MRRPRIFQIILGLLLIGTALNQAFSQMHAKCGSNPVALSSFCMDACVVCDLNGVSARTLNITPGQMPPGFCTMVQHSMQWLAFVAGSSSLSINVAVSSCMQANGVEMGIYASSDCQTFKLVSNCNTNMYANQTWSFSTTEPLKIGCVYYLVFDGNGPNECNVDFVVTAGSTMAPIPNTTAKISGKKLVCKGETIDYMIATINGACDYEWRVENGTINFSKDNQAQVSWDQPGIGKICVTGSNICNTGNEVCLDVEIGDDTPLQEFGPYYVCFGESYKFKNLYLTAGTWNYFNKNRFGCDSNISVVVEEFEQIQTFIDTFVCYPDSFKLGTNFYDSTGVYKQTLKSKKAPFCDSILNVNLKYSKLKSIPNKSNDISCVDTLVTLFADSSLVPKNVPIKRYWINEFNDTLGTGNQISISQAGIYKLVLISEFDSIHTCISSQSILVKGSKKNPDLLLLHSLTYCTGDSIFLKSIRFTDLNNTNATYHFYWDQNASLAQRIDSTYIILKNDNTIYLKAFNGICEDLLALPIKINSKDYFIFKDSSFCAGSFVNLLNLDFTKQGQFPGDPQFYSCPKIDSNCLIQNQLIRLNQDTTIYMVPLNSQCPQFSSVKLNARPIPSAAFKTDLIDYCKGDTVRISWTPFDKSTIYKLQFDQTQFLLAAGDTFYYQSGIDTGKHTICFNADRLGCIDSSCNSIFVHAAPNIPLPLCFSTDSSILFSWNKYSSESYSIEVLQGGNYVQVSDTSVFFPNLNRGEIIKLRIHASNPYCKEVVSEIECQSKTCPPIQLIIDPVDTICLGNSSQTVQLTAQTNPIGQTGIFKWRGPGIVDSVAGIFDPMVSGAGYHRIFSTLDINGCKYFDSRVILVRKNPFSDFLLDSVACQDSSIVIRFTGNNADSSSFNWGLDGALFKFLIPDKELAVSWQTPGTKKLKLLLSFTKCFSEAEKTIEILEHLEKPIIDCETTDSSITFKWNKNARVKNYKIKVLNGNSGMFINDTTYWIRKRFFNDSASIQLSLEDTGPCSEVSSDVLLCKSPDCPPKNIAIDTSLEICKSNPVQLDLVNWVKDSVKNRLWTGEAIQNGVIHTQDLALGIHNYFIEANDFGCLYRDTILLKINPSPVILEFTQTNIPCDPMHQTGSLSFDAILTNKLPIRYSIDGGNYSTNNSFQQIGVGSHVFSVIDSLGCKTDTLLVWKAPEIPLVELGPDLEIFKGDLVNLNALITGNFLQIDWISSQDLSCVNCTNPGLRPQQNMIIYCIIQNADGCTAIDSISIRIIDNKVYVPNVFSPNGDNINDLFTIFGNAKTIKLLEIFDRWGNRVYSNKEFQPNGIEGGGWNGRFNNQYCLPGVYVYYAIVSFEKGPDIQLKGDLQLLR